MVFDRLARPSSGTAAAGFAGGSAGRSPAAAVGRGAVDWMWPSLAGRPNASPISQRVTSLTCTMPRGSSSDSRNSGTRETPAASKVFNSSQTVSLSSTAMMSARGTITSTTRSAPKRKMRNSISRSSAEKARPSPAPLSASSSIERKVGAPGKPRRARNAASQLWGSSAAVDAPSDLSVIDLTLMAGNQSTPLSRGRSGRGRSGIGVGNADGGQDLGLQALHLLSRGLGLMVVSEQVQQAVNHEVLEMMPGVDAAVCGLVADGLGRQHDIAQVGAIARGRPGRRLVWERQDVGGRVLAAIGLVEVMHQGVAAEDDADLQTVRG